MCHLIVTITRQYSKMAKIKTSKFKKRRNDNAALIAEFFSVTPNYVRKVIADKDQLVYSGIKSQKIRQAYHTYKNYKEQIISNLKEVNNISIPA